MLKKYPLVAAAVAAAITSGYVFAAVPAQSAAAATANSLVVSGSSAASSAFGTAFENDLCGGSSNTLIAASTGGSGNFLAFSCNITSALPAAGGGSAIPVNSVVTIYYRTEGGSVVGALPIAAFVNGGGAGATGAKIKRLNLADTTDCTLTGNKLACAVNGATQTDGPADTWTGAVTPDIVHLGVTDVEPAQLINADSPLPPNGTYHISAFGNATSAQLANLATTPLFQQVFGLVVNTSGQTFHSVNLTREAAANILLGNYGDWNSVPDGNNTSGGAAISNVSSPITVIHREQGSGTRTQANIYFLSYGCGSATPMNDGNPSADNFSTHDELVAANKTPGAIAYASIDQILNPANGTTFANLVLASINGIAPSAQAAAAGQYDDWFEATFVPNPSVTSGPQATLSNWLTTNLPDIGTAPGSPDVNVIPGATVGNTSGIPFTNNGKAGTAEIFVNPYTRSLHSCSVPTETN